ncbi:MAG: hypothetical protein Q8R40_01645 [bacterium]|nr:hypothetical protein [bacterium]
MTKDISKAEAEKIIAYQREKLHLGSNVVITLNLVEKKYVAHVRWNIGNTTEFDIELSSHQIKTSSMRHEMYHICRIHKEGASKIGGLRYILIEEPLAIIYENTGINLACRS